MPQYETELLHLYSLQAQIRKDPYLHAHSRNLAVIRRQVAIFERCQGIFKGAHTILDWGCRHAADACMVRMLCGEAPELHGCDVDIDETTYRIFFDFAGLKFSKLAHPYLLPYEDDSFDVVIGSGVLEHVPNDSESLKELYRIIRPGGYFLMTMLPNRYSYTEWINRRRGKPAHLRLYSLAEARHMFIHHGFRPMDLGYHQFLPTLSSLEAGLFDQPLANRLVEGLFKFNSLLEKLWPIKKFSTNVFVLGQKVLAFHG
jgi:SAM-dependent methyltransferase